MFWEYKVDQIIATAKEDDIAKLLNKRGNERWELVGMYESDGVVTFIFKQSKPDPLPI